MTDRMTVLTANGKLWVFDHAQLAKTDTLGDCDNDRQLEIAICTFCSPTLQFLAVGRCRNHLANLLSSSSSSNIPNLALEFRRYLPEFQRCNYFWFWRPYRYFRLSVAVVLICQLTAIHGLIPQICRWTFNCTFHNLIDMYLRFRPPFPIVGHYWNRLDTLPASLPRSNAIGSPLEFWWYMSQFRRYYYFRLLGCRLGLSTRGSVGHGC